MDTKRQRMTNTARWAMLALGVVLALGLPRPAVGQVSFAKSDFPTGPWPFAVAVADLNRDGHPDFVVANNGDSTVSVLLGTGTGSFGDKTDFPTGAEPIVVVVADLKGDGHL